MGKRLSRNSQRATQQRITAGYNIASDSSNLSQPTKAELRAMIPPYDEALVRRIDAKPKKKKRRV